MHAAAAPAFCRPIRYSDQGSYRWLWTHAPCSWQEHVTLHFARVPMASLRPAGCWINPSVVAAHQRTIAEGRTLSPLVVCASDPGGWYIHDGNHRYHALREVFAGNDTAMVRVAIAVPSVGFQFVYRWFGTYGTYLLEPVAPPLQAPLFSGRTLVLVAHQDDETACAGLLQRLTDPIITFATDGAPADNYFWARYGSRGTYAIVRRKEAITALAKLRVSNITFLEDYAPAALEFRDQQLFRVLPEAFESVSALIHRYRPDAVLVPAYEGGHPDHDSCSFLGMLLRRHFGLSVWEMPLYHRSATGELVCQQFRERNGTERSLVLSRAEKQLRENAIASYASQADVRQFVSAGVEVFRPQAEYDYTRPPHPGAVNYEVWGWPITAVEVSQAFANYALAMHDAGPTYFPPAAATKQSPTPLASAGA